MFRVLCSGEEPRVKSAQLIVKKLQDITGGTPVILVGDLNAGGYGDHHDFNRAENQTGAEPVDTSC